MKISKRLMDYTKFGAAMFGSIAAMVTVASEFGEHRHDIFDAARKIITSVLDHFFPSIPINYQILNLIVWSIVIVFLATTWIIMYLLFRRLFKRFLEGLVFHLILELEDPVQKLSSKAYEEILQEPLKGLEDKVERLHRAVKPLVPPSAISGTACSIPGVYRIQDEGFQGAEKTFAEDEIFPSVPHPQTSVEVKVTWVHQSPARWTKTSDLPDGV